MNDTMTINDLLGAEERHAMDSELSDAELAMVFGGSMNPLGTIVHWVFTTVGGWAGEKALDAGWEAEQARRSNIQRDQNGIPITPNWTNEPHGA